MILRQLFNFAYVNTEDPIDDEHICQLHSYNFNKNTQTNPSDARRFSIVRRKGAVIRCPYVSTKRSIDPRNTF